MLAKTQASILIAVLSALFSILASAQDVADEGATITYPASYFAQYGPVSVNDMLSRIPGIDLALEGNQVPSFGNRNTRGLGSSSQILINGKRLAGKANEASTQLDRITADQVDYIEIIRGTSGDLDVRNNGQLVNIVLLQSLPASSLSTEIGLTYSQDGTIKPLGSFSYSGQTGLVNYLLSADISSGYRFQKSFETSVLADNSIKETRAFDRYTEQTIYRLNSNLVYQPTAADRFAFNTLYSESDPPSNLVRTITDFQSTPSSIVSEREELPSSADNWELGGDYEHNFADGGKYRILFIINERNQATTRERFVSTATIPQETKNLFLDTAFRYRERIIRTSYTWNVARGQALEMGLEGAQTTQNSSLRLGLNVPGIPAPEFGGLTPISIPNAVSEVEEIRYEGFATHNWQINSRMSLESSLLYEVSVIEQTGDINKKRNFDFIKPKLDFRFDINQSFQIRMSAEKDVSQLSFADFSAGVNAQDDDQDTVAGNPELEQEETWRYNINLDYRLPNDGGVLNSRFFYYDVGKSIGKIDVTTNPQNIISANGNVSDGKIFGLYSNASIRLGFLKLPQAVITAALNLEEAYLYDPLIGKERTIVPFDRGNYRISYRHDMPERGLSFGFSYQDGIGKMGGTGGNRVIYDIDNVTFFNGGKVRSNLSLFAEKTGIGNFTYRMEIDNSLNFERCTRRKRYNGYLRDGDLSEIENICSTTGVQFVFKAKAVF